MAAVFISYRRDDTRASTGRLYETLSNSLGPHRVYKDVDSVPLAVDFREAIREAISTSSLVIAVIGPNWGSPEGLARLANPSDNVRFELEQALSERVPVLPVMVDGASMPNPEQLPHRLRPIVYRNAAVLSHDTWQRDMHQVLQLVKGLDDPIPDRTDRSGRREKRRDASFPASSVQTKGVNRRPVMLWIIGAVLLSLSAWLSFGYFGIQTLFVDAEVDDDGPVFESAVSTSSPTTTTSGAEDEEFAPTPRGSTTSTTTTTVPPPAVVTLYSGSFQGQDGYSVAGNALVLNDGSEQRFLRLEDFDSNNGPDLHVYLRSGDDSLVDLGELKGNIGDQNYEIPSDVDLNVFHTVQIWCVRFGVLYGDARLFA